MRLDEKKRLIAACKDLIPLSAEDQHGYYFDFDALGLRGAPWRRDVADVIRLAGEGEKTHQIVSGLRGSGKSTELARLEADLRADCYHVVRADIGQWLGDTRPIEVSDIQLALALALFPDGRPGSAAGWLKDYTERAWNLLKTEVRVEQLQASGPLGLRADLRTQATLFEQMAASVRTTRRFQDEVFGLLRHAARDAQSAQEPLVLLLDGAEKRATGDALDGAERERFQNTWITAFLHNAAALKPPVHTVITVPPFMIRRANEIENAFGTRFHFLPMVRVSKRGGALNRDGIIAARSALFQRVPMQHFSDPIVPAWLVAQSGGFMRDLLRLARTCVYRCDGEDAVIDEAVARAAVAEVRQTYLEGYYETDRDDLVAVHQSGRSPLKVLQVGPGGVEVDNASQHDRLLQSNAMLRYHNAEFWYGAHPLLREALGLEAITLAEVAEVLGEG